MPPLLLLALALLADPAPVALDALRPVGRPVWVDGGKRLAFPAKLDTAKAGAGERWYLLSADGASATALTPEPLYESTEAVWWHPAGDRFAYVGDDKDRRTMFVWGVGDPEPTRFAVVGKLRRPVAAWAGDGSYLAFALANAPKADSPYDLFITAVNGANPSRVPMRLPPAAIAWSPDARRYAFLVQEQGVLRLFSCRRDLEIVAPLCPHLTAWPRSLSWSPDGSLLAFAGSADLNRGAKLYITTPSGLDLPVRLDRPGYLPDAPPVWSPDGRWLAWVAGPLSDPRRGRVWLAPTKAAASAKELVFGVGGGEPSFSTDGETLYFVRYDAWDPARGRLASVLTSDPGRLMIRDGDREAHTLVLSPDGARMAVVSGEAARAKLRVIALWPAPPGDVVNR